MMADESDRPPSLYDDLDNVAASDVKLRAQVESFAARYGLDDRWILDHGIPRAKTARDMERQRHHISRSWWAS